MDCARKFREVGWIFDAHAPPLRPLENFGVVHSGIIETIVRLKRSLITVFVRLLPRQQPAWVTLPVLRPWHVDRVGLGLGNDVSVPEGIVIYVLPVPREPKDNVVAQRLGVRKLEPLGLHRRD